MSATAIYLIPDTLAQQYPLQSLVDRLLAAHNPVPLPPWSLEHRLYRSAPAPTPDSPEAAHEHRFHHVLALSHHPRKAYAYITGANVITLPTSQANALNGLLSTKMALLWHPRASLTAANGVAYEVGPHLTVRMADLRQLGQQGQHRGTIVCIQDHATASEKGDPPSEEKIKVEDGIGSERLARVRKLWASFDVQKAKEFTADPTGESESDGSGEIKAWCDALRLRG